MALTLNYTEYGAGPPIVILHGLFGSARNWHAIAKQLESTHRVYALDLRNHGNSPWHDSMTYYDLADDVRGFIEQHNLEQAVVIGHSMGGKTAMYLALQYQELVGTLIVVDIAPMPYQHSFISYVQAMQGLNLGGLSRRDEADEALSAEVLEPGVRMFLLQNLVYRDKQFGWRINLPALSANMAAITDFPNEVTNRIYFGKTLVTRGGQSIYVQPDHHRTIYALFPNAGITVIPSAGHWVHADQPAALVGAIRAIL
jgi:pimeloyl-ACP methyl ester carboxylesterase